MEKVNSRIINADVTEFKNTKTGEVTTMTKLTYTYSRENSEKYLGPNIVTCYIPGNILSKIKPYVDSNDRCVLELEERLDPKTNQFKKVVKKINNTEV